MLALRDTSSTRRTLAGVLAVVLGLAVLGPDEARADRDRDERAPESFTFDLPEIDPANLPPELQPLDVERPLLPKSAAAEVTELEARVTELEQAGLTAETRAQQDVALHAAIDAAERVLSLREEHQGNSVDRARWRDADGAPVEWFEVGDARRRVDTLAMLLRMSEADRRALARLLESDTEIYRLYGEGKYAEVKEVVERDLAVRRRVLGPEHPSTLDRIHKLGSLLLSLGRLDEAEAPIREALDARRRILGDDHPQTLGTLGNLAFLFEDRGNLLEAEPLYRRELAGKRRILGDEDPATLNAIANFGGLLVAQGRLLEVEPYWRMALAVRLRVLGEDHIRTIDSIHNLGVLLESQGRPNEAEMCYREAVSRSRRVLGDDHPHTLSSINNLGVVLQGQGRFAEAEPYFREALETRRRELGNDHPDTLNSIGNMGALLKAQGRLDEAEIYWREALEGFRRRLGEEHSRTLTAASALGALILVQHRLDEAEQLLRPALEAQRRTLGDDHPDTLISIGYMADLLRAQGDLAGAESHYREVLEVYRRELGDDRVETVGELVRLALLLHDRGNLAEAERCYAEALARTERLRTDVIGSTSERASLSGKLGLGAVTAGYAALLADTGRPVEALGVVERGRARAALDLIGRESDDLVAALRSLDDPARLARYEDRVTRRQAAIVALREAESRLAALPEDSVERTRLSPLVQTRRRELGERNWEVYAELRGLVPAGSPLSGREIGEALEPGVALLSFSWTSPRVIVLVARNGGVESIGIAEGADEVEDLRGKLLTLRRAITAELPGASSVDDAVTAVRAKLFPPSLRQATDDAALLIVVPDGPLHDVPLELVIEDVPIAYAPSATIAIDRWRASRERDRQAKGSVVLGAPAFGSSTTSTTGALTLEQIRLHGGSLDPLPGTRLEATMVASLLGTEPDPRHGCDGASPPRAGLRPPSADPPPCDARTDRECPAPVRGEPGPRATTCTTARRHRVPHS